MGYQRYLDWVNERIATRPGRIVLLFLVVTVVFTSGLGAIETETGQQQFIEDLESYETFQDVQRDFGDSFGESTTTTTLLQQDTNALSKQSLLRSLRAQERIADKDGMRVSGTSSPARDVARTIDPDATTLDAQIVAVEGATEREIDQAVRTTAETNSGFRSSVSEDFNREAASASVTESTVTHDAAEIDNREERVRDIVDTVGGDIRVLGGTPNTITTSLGIVLPAAFVLIVGFLVVAYRDLVDLVLGIVAIVMALVWTFGFIGLADIAFNPLLVSVPPLLIAVGIDFGIHVVNRYREERGADRDITDAMTVTSNQVLVAFFIVTGTTVIGFLSNLVSAFPPNRDFGVVAAIGIVFTFLIFGVFLPAAKVYTDRLRERYPIPTFSQSPFGSEGAASGRVLSGGVTVARRTPVIFLVVVLLATTAAGGYATGVATEFDSDDFLPEEETPDFLQYLGPLAPPEEFQAIENRNLRDRHFDQEEQVIVYIEANMRRDDALESLHRASQNPPATIDGEGREAEVTSLVTVIRDRAERDPQFRALVARNDLNDNGIPDDNLPVVYDALAERGQLSQFLSEDRRSTQVIYTADGTATNAEISAAGDELAAGYEGDASPTGIAIVFNAAGTLILDTVLQSLAITIVGSALFLVGIYWVLEGKPSLGVANMVPIAVAIVALVATMRYVGIDFNAINGGILAITVGLGTDYSVHVVHRFADEREERALEPALRRTVVGTGGALTGSMLTTVGGIGVLVLALNPVIGNFGLLTALSVVYAYLASMFILPSVLVVWDRLRRYDGESGSVADSVFPWTDEPGVTTDQGLATAPTGGDE
ncbi:efflux RND transporter permease subunit [Haloarcula onubensis]|uniref:MMPL family transporter n=1 Tax=Haloarcula onubensis TaxID=2950539 RepID=A0ABU2FPI4_9EURY|nr:MMPL family transporter [Halomicroarcula sp. S3CR25-11]MDS0282334.1 MMPL family transporter [Halomicroarcula sp. S3CR25-11]